MKPVVFAATLAVALSASGLAALTLGRGMPVFPDTPARAHQALGPVVATSEVRPLGTPWLDLHAPLLRAEARSRYGRVDAIVRARDTALPHGGGTRSSGIAVRFD